MIYNLFFPIQGFKTMEANTDNINPDHYDPNSPKNKELMRRIGELHDMIEVLEEKDSNQYLKFKSRLERESGNDPRYAKLLEATSDLVSKALCVRPDTSKLTKSFNRAYFEIMRHILQILINQPEKTTIPLVQWDIDYKIRHVEQLHVQATNMENTYYRTIDWINNKAQPDRNREAVHQLWNRHYRSKNELTKIIESENKQTLKNYRPNSAELKKLRDELEKLNREVNNAKRKSEIAKFGDDYHYRKTGGTYAGYGPDSYCY